MAQNYATDVLGKIDERFYTESKTGTIINNGIELEFSNGNNAVTIYNVDVVSENDYQRSGTMRFGQLVEIGTGTQTFTLSQDKSFAISVDRGNLEDSKMAARMDEVVKRQVREVSVPTTDKYRLAVLTAYAIANSQTPANETLTSSTVFTSILGQRAELMDAEVPMEDIVLFIKPTIEMLLWQDATFKAACDISTQDKKTGVLGTVMGMTVVVVPESYFAASTYNYLMVSRKVLIAPTKFNSIKTDDGFAFGIDGMVAQGRRYYDAFIPTNKGAAIRLSKTA